MHVHGRSRRAWWLGLVMGIVVLALLVSGCAKEAVTTAPTTTAPTAPLKEETLRIGVLQPLTGPGAGWGRLVLYAVELKLDKYNAAGGVVIGDTKYKFEILTFDTKYQAALAVEGANKFIYEDGIKHIWGPLSSAGALAAGPIAAKTKTLMYVACWNDDILKPEYPYSYRMLFVPNLVAPAEYQWIKDNNPGIETVSHLAPNDATGWDISRVELEIARGLGWEVVDELFFERGTTEFTPLLTKIMANPPDILQLGGSPTEQVGIIAKQIRGLGYTGLLASVSPLPAAEVVPIARAEAAEGLIHTEPNYDSAMVPAALREWANELYATYGAEHAGAMGAAKWVDGVEVMVEAMRRAGSVDPAAVKAVLDDPTQRYDGIMGTEKIGGPEVEEIFGAGRTRQLVHPWFIAQIRDGQDETVGIVYPAGLQPE